MFTLGINAVFHDSSACILKDGKLLAAAEEERFTHIKHGKRSVPFSTYELPYHAINYCLGVAAIHMNEVDHFAYSFDPYLLKLPFPCQFNLKMIMLNLRGLTLTMLCFYHILWVNGQKVG